MQNIERTAFPDGLGKLLQPVLKQGVSSRDVGWRSFTFMLLKRVCEIYGFGKCDGSVTFRKPFYGMIQLKMTGRTGHVSGVTGR